MNTTHKAWRLAAYGALALPLAMAALPVYVHIPKFYVDHAALDLAAVGLLLLAVRAIDALSDPLIGIWSDAASARDGHRRRLFWLGLPMTAVGMWGLFSPPGDAGYVWLALSLSITYLGFSLVNVSYLAWGSEVSRDIAMRTRVTAWREGAGLIGVLLGAALPAALAARMAEPAAFAAFAWLFLACLVVTSAATLAFGPPPIPPAGAPSLGLRKALCVPFANPAFRPLLVTFMLSGIAAAIPATLFLYFVRDVVGRADLQAQFLLLYFVAAACGLPGWVMLSARVGKARAWFIGMLAAIAAFVWAAFLGQGQVLAFATICVLSGLALGADLALPASLLADVIDVDETRGLGRNEGAYFGLWALAVKLNTALAAGAALPLLAALGFDARPGAAQSAQGLTALAITYAGLPCLLKLLSAVVLIRSSLAKGTA